MFHALWSGGGDAAAIEAAWAADPQLSDPGARLYAFDDHQFERMMQSIAAAGRTTPSHWDDLFPSHSAPPFWITFDDGHRSNHELALPVLQRLGLRAVFFIVTDWIGTPGFMTEDQLRALRQAGMLLGTHGCSHDYFADMDEGRLRRELTDSKARLEAVLGEPVPAVSLPGGRNHPALRRLAAEAGYRHVFTSRTALAAPDGDPMDWPRIALTQRMAPDLIDRLLAGDDRQIRAMARWERRRAWAKRLLGNAAYDRLRAMLLKKKS